MKSFIYLVVIAMGAILATSLFGYYTFMYDNAFIDRRSEDKTVLNNTIGLQAKNPNLIRDGSELVLMFYLMENIDRTVTWFKINDNPPFEVNDDWLMNKSSKVRNLYDTYGPYKLGLYLDNPVDEYSCQWDATNNRFYIQIRID